MYKLCFYWKNKMP